MYHAASKLLQKLSETDLHVKEVPRLDPVYNADEQFPEIVLDMDDRRKTILMHACSSANSAIFEELFRRTEDFCKAEGNTSQVSYIRNRNGGLVPFVIFLSRKAPLVFHAKLPSEKSRCQ